MTDIRWKQRLSHYKRALAQLDSAAAISAQRPLSSLEEQGLIQAFEFTHELAWNLLRDYFSYQGISNITGSRDATREAFNKGLISDGHQWMNMIVSRNLSSHTYNQDVAKALGDSILKDYLPLFIALRNKMEGL